MSRIDRRSLIQLLIGLIATVAGFASVTWLRQRRCAEVGGHWEAALGACAGPAGRIDVARGSDIVAGVLIGIVLVFMLLRASTFASRRGA